MQRLQFSTDINAPREKVWQVLWEDGTYRVWTSAFSEGSYAVSDWKERSKILFLSPAGDGMFSTIARRIPNEVMAFQHLGVVKNGQEEPLNEETQKWSGSMEVYTLKDKEGMTELTVELDAVETFLDFFKETFPKALHKVKELSEL